MGKNFGWCQGERNYMPGLDRNLLDSVDSDVLFGRIRNGMRSDFLLAPHYRFVFSNSASELWDQVRQQLQSGNYTPGLPLTINVPKPRGFARPGAILEPIDRIVYQLLADLTATDIEEAQDRNRVFSNALLSPDIEHRMFQPAADCWSRMQAKIKSQCSQGGYFIKADISHYFERLPHHRLINLMRSINCAPGAVNLLEEILLAFRERNSFGIIQGVYPSDLFGNCFLSGFDSYCDLEGVPSSRFVDDIYLYFPDERSASEWLIRISEYLRLEGLNLNENKSGILAAELLLHDETLLDKLFEDARNQAENEVFPVDSYGFPLDWDYEDSNSRGPEADVEIETEAFRRLFDQTKNEDFRDQSDKIERFCLPYFAAAGDAYAADSVLDSFLLRPHMTSSYLSYLSNFAKTQEDISIRLQEIFNGNEAIFEYQDMYLMVALLNGDYIKSQTVNKALKILSNRNRVEANRALAALFAAKFGSAHQRNTVRLQYQNESSKYVRAALLFAARYYTAAEKSTCKRAWGRHSLVNSLIASAI